MSTPFVDLASDPPIRGFLHEPSQPSGRTLVLTHGAGANCQSKLLVEMSEAFAAAGFTVLRFDLPFRSERPYGPPSPGSAVRDRDGLRRAVELIRDRERLATILVSEDSQLVDGLLLLSYPLHPPRKPDQLRTSHFPKLNKPALFVHGTRDPFGTIPEMSSSLKLIPGSHNLFEVDGAGHDLLIKKALGELPARVVSEFQIFVKKSAK
jgi:predicted alpha/beta-hydrolase family hydrolase